MVLLLSREMVRNDRDVERTRIMKAKRRVLHVWRSRRRRKRGSEIYSRPLKRRYARTYMIGMCDSPASLVIYRVHRPFIPARSDDEAALSSRIVALNMLELSLANLDLEVDTEANASLDTVLHDCGQSTFVFFPVTISHNPLQSTPHEDLLGLYSSIRCIDLIGPLGLDIAT